MQKTVRDLLAGTTGKPFSVFTAGSGAYFMLNMPCSPSSESYKHVCMELTAEVVQRTERVCTEDGLQEIVTRIISPM